MNDNTERLVDITIIAIIISVIILKIIGVIKITWFWLLSPLWILFGLGVAICVVITGSVVIMDLINRIKERKNERY